MKIQNPKSKISDVKVLYIEDDPGEARLLQKMLERKGYMVDLAQDGEQGLSMCEERAYDVLIVDQSMPVYSGLEVIYNLSSRGSLPPTIMVTGAGDEKVAVEAMKLGCSDYVVKDVEGGYRELLQSIIGRVLKQHRLAEAKRRAEEELELLADLVENAKHVMIFIVTRDGRIVRCNALARDTFKYTESEMLSRNMDTLFKLEGESGWGKVAEHVKQESRWRGDLVGVCKDGREIPVEVAANRSQNHEMNKGKIICFVRDVRREKEIDRMKSEFISVASHEMRTPLTSLKNAVDIVLERKAGEINEAQERFMSMAAEDINRLGNLIDRLLNISKIEAGGIVLNYHEMEIKTTIGNVVKALRPLAEKKSISLTRKVAPRLPEVYADAPRIEEVLINLIGNAVKFTPDHGTITVEAYQMEETPEDMPQDVKGYVDISVTDTGIGIPEELTETVFDKFYQVKSSLSGNGLTGTGLGLAISKGIVEGHGGQIRCTSKVGKGSTFCFTLPIIDKEKAFYSRLKDHISKAMQTRAPLSALVFEIGDFEGLIQRCGRKECTDFLEEIEEMIIEMGLKTTDIIEVIPWNGQILVLMPCTDRAGARVVEKRIRDHISGKGITVGDNLYRPSFVSGVATFHEEGVLPEELIDLVKKRMKKLNF